MQTDVNPITKQAPSEIPSAQLSIGPPGWGLETRDTKLGTRDSGGKTRTPVLNSRSCESRIPNPETRNPNSETGFSIARRRVSDTGHHLTPQQLQFLLRVTPPALASQHQYEVPACVTIAQAILESATAVGWGSSTLFRLANKPFGIKCAHFGAEENPSTQQSARSTLKPGTRESGPGKEDSKFKIQNSGFRIPNSETSQPNPGFRILNRETAVPNFGCAHPITRSSEHPIPEAYGHFDAPAWEIENGQKKAIIDQFQRFPNLDKAFGAHARLLCSPRYRPAFAVRDDWKQFAERLGPKASPLDMEHCGYSTNPSYSAEIITLVGRYRLNDPRALQWFATGKDPGHRAIEPSDHRAIGENIAGSTDEPLKSFVACNS
ncbi:MAG TPA: hypothetical protein VKO18_10630 [Terriglobia bacterium]|nr:hypothetical protein [Terriglobia bacterium]